VESLQQTMTSCLLECIEFHVQALAYLRPTELTAHTDRSDRYTEVLRHVKSARTALDTITDPDIRKRYVDDLCDGIKGLANRF